MLQVVPYSKEYEDKWNEFVEHSKNGTFLFNRTYMEYHADRFTDASLLFLEEKKIVGLLPASVHGKTIVTHGGLTYGGIVSDRDMKISRMMQIFEVFFAHAKSSGFEKIIYKPVPHVFHKLPSEEDLYVLHRSGARLVRRDLSSVIYLPQKSGFSKGRRENIKKSRIAGVEVRESRDFDSFFEIGRVVLSQRHGTLPVHSATEMIKLADCFPQNIKLYASFLEDVMLSGVLLFKLNAHAVHTQYMFNSESGRNVGALDAILDYLVNDLYADMSYFSFGISTEDNGLVLNEGLALQKEMFGGRSVVHDFYELVL